MSMDTIGDFLTAIRNGIMVSKRTVTMPFSRLKMDIAKVLKEEGYIKDFKKEAVGNHNVLTIYLKYVNGESVIHEITRVSKPGRRHYEKLKNVEPVVGGLGIAILTTSAGVITDRQAHQKLTGGEVICRVW